MFTSADFCREVTNTIFEHFLFSPGKFQCLYSFGNNIIFVRSAVDLTFYDYKPNWTPRGGGGGGTPYNGLYGDVPPERA